MHLSFCCSVNFSPKEQTKSVCVIQNEGEVQLVSNLKTCKQF